MLEVLKCFGYNIVKCRYNVMTMEKNAQDWFGKSDSHVIRDETRQFQPQPASITLRCWTNYWTSQFCFAFILWHE